MITIIEDGKQISDAFEIKALGLRAHSYSIEAPQLQTNYIEIPGRDGALDLTEALGKQTYRNRLVKFSGLFYGDSKRFHAMISETMNRFNGKYLKVIFGNDPEHYWTGRCSVEHERIEEDVYGVTFNMNADPYKYGLYSSDEDWLWDPFSFLTGVIRGYRDVSVSGTKDLRVVGYDRELSPVITASATMTLQVRKNGQALWDEYSLTAGQNIPEGLSVISTDPRTDYYTFRFTGTGTVTISMKEASL